MSKSYQKGAAFLQQRLAHGTPTTSATPQSARAPKVPTAAAGAEPALPPRKDPPALPPAPEREPAPRTGATTHPAPQASPPPVPTMDATKPPYQKGTSFLQERLAHGTSTPSRQPTESLSLRSTQQAQSPPPELARLMRPAQSPPLARIMRPTPHRAAPARPAEPEPIRMRRSGDRSGRAALLATYRAAILGGPAGKRAVERGLKLTYTPTNLDVYCCAYSGALGGMTGGRVISGSNYVEQALDAGIWAQEFDTLWASSTQLDEVQAESIFLQSYAVWDGRAPSSITAAEVEDTIEAIIDVIDDAETFLASQGITPPSWNTGGGSGGGVPVVPADSVGWLLTSINSTGSSEPALTGSAWEPSGGFGILSFSKNHGTSFEVGNSDVSPTFTATYDGEPTAAEIVYTTQPGSPLVLTTPFTSGQILQTFVETTNGATATFELEATFSSGTKTATLTDTWGLPFLSIIDTTTNIVATQAYLNTMRAANGAQVHTSAAGTYLNGDNVGAGQISAIAIPTALDVGVVWTDNETGFPVSPSFIGTVAGYTNPYGVVVSMNLYTVGGVDVGTVSWSLS